MEYKLDMSMMFAIHDALRRELAQVTRIARVPDDNPGPQLRAALGWELFKKFLTVHHTTEDDVLWPTLRAQVAAQPDRLALADALEAEHAVIEPLLAAYREQWAPRYAALTIWPATGEPATAW